MYAPKVLWMHLQSVENDGADVQLTKVVDVPTNMEGFPIQDASYLMVGIVE